MTVCVGVKVRDCIVFAADSAVSMISTSGGQPIVQNVWNHGIKVYNLHKELPIIAMWSALATWVPRRQANLPSI